MTLRCSARRIPSLDGLRGFSIICVIIGHVNDEPGLRWGEVVRTNLPWLPSFGVQFFFVISGFLITGLLLDELESTGTVSLRRFYFRRTLRIFPAYYAFLAAMSLAGVLGWLPVPQRQVLQAAAYVSNYAHLTIGRAFLDYPLGHTWSLAVEEQFYLIWPAALLLLGIRRAPWAMVAILVLVPVATIVEARSMPEAIGSSFETVASSLAAGVLLLLVSRRHPVRVGRVLEGAWVLPVAFGLAVLLQVAPGPFTRIWMLQGTLTACAVAVVIGWCVQHHDGRVGRALNTRAAAYVGTLSYSLYLWQQPFLSGYALVDGWWHRSSVAVVLVVLCALASYYFVERPALRWRARIEGARARR